MWGDGHQGELSALQRALAAPPVQAAHTILRKPLPWGPQDGSLGRWWGGDPALSQKPQPSGSSPGTPGTPQPPSLTFSLESGFVLQFVAGFCFFFPSLSCRSLSGILLHTEVGKSSAAASGNLVSPAPWHQWVILQLSTWLPRHRQLCLWKSSWYRLGAALALKALGSFSAVVRSAERSSWQGVVWKARLPARCQVLGEGDRGPSLSIQGSSWNSMARNMPSSAPGGLRCTLSGFSGQWSQLGSVGGGESPGLGVRTSGLVLSDADLTCGVVWGEPLPQSGSQPFHFPKLEEWFPRPPTKVGVGIQWPGLQGHFGREAQ